MSFFKKQIGFGEFGEFILPSWFLILLLLWAVGATLVALYYIPASNSSMKNIGNCNNPIHNKK